MIQNTPPYWSHIALETASNLGFAKIARYQGLSESQDFLNLLLAFRTMCATAELFINSLEEAMCTVSKYDAAAWFYQHGLVTLSNVSNLSSLSKGSGKSALSNIHTW